MGKENNEIGSRGAVAIAEYLETNSTLLENLELDNNRFNDDDAIVLSQALRKNSNLHRILVRGNNFSVAGVKSLFKAVFDSSSMNSVSESNHACQLELFSNEERIQEYLGFLNAEHRDVVRMAKMMIALRHSKESLLNYLEDVPLVAFLLRLLLLFLYLQISVPICT